MKIGLDPIAAGINGYLVTVPPPPRLNRVESKGFRALSLRQSPVGLEPFHFVKFHRASLFDAIQPIYASQWHSSNTRRTCTTFSPFSVRCIDHRSTDVGEYRAHYSCVVVSKREAGREDSYVSYAKFRVRGIGHASACQPSTLNLLDVGASIACQSRAKVVLDRRETTAYNNSEDFECRENREYRPRGDRSGRNNRASGTIA